jgi:hypothetical protein
MKVIKDLTFFVIFYFLMKGKLKSAKPFSDAAIAKSSVV